MFTDFGRISRLSDSTADCCLLDQEQQRVTDDIQQVGVLAQKLSTILNFMTIREYVQQ